MSEPILDVLAEPQSDPMPVAINRNPRMIGNKELAEYAKETGVKLVKLKAIKKKALLGELIEKLGAAQYGTAVIFESPEMIQDAIKQCEKMMDDYPHEPDVMAQLMKAKVSLIDLHVKAGQALVKAKKDAAEAPQVAPQQMAFPAGQPVQVNLQFNNVDKTAEQQ
jgi:hypothetical protein